MDARNIRARRTAVITDFLPDTFLGLLLGKAEALCAVLVPAGIHYASIGSGRNAAKGPAANGPTAGIEVISPLRVPSGLWYTLFQS
jgi:hypothetical protein